MTGKELAKLLYEIDCYQLGRESNWDRLPPDTKAGKIEKATFYEDRFLKKKRPLPRGRNKHTAECYKCHHPVFPGEGYYEGRKGEWKVQHKDCYETVLVKLEDVETGYFKYKGTIWTILDRNPGGPTYLCRAETKAPERQTTLHFNLTTLVEPVGIEEGVYSISGELPYQEKPTRREIVEQEHARLLKALKTSQTNLGAARQDLQQMKEILKSTMGEEFDPTASALDNLIEMTNPSTIRELTRFFTTSLNTPGTTLQQATEKLVGKIQKERSI